MTVVRTDLQLDLEDLPFASTLRAIDDGVPGDYLAVNTAFLDLYGISEAPLSPTAFMGDDARGPDEMDRRVATRNEPVNYDLRFRGRRMSLQKTPVVREGRVAAVLTAMTSQGWLDDEVLDGVPLGQLADVSTEAMSLVQIGADSIQTLSQNRAAVAFDRFLATVDDASGEQARDSLRSFAHRAGEMRVPLSNDINVGGRHFRVRSEVVSDPSAETWLVTQTLVDVSDSVRLDWFEQLVEIAAAGTVSEAVDHSFELLQRLLGFDRSAFVQFDGDIADVLASTVDLESHQRRHADGRMIELLSSAAVVTLPTSVGESDLLRVLEVAEGAGILLLSGGRPWGSLVIGHRRPTAVPMTPFTTSMLETLGSTLAILIERDGARRHLQESNRRLESYAHVAAHDLRSPLRRIRSFAQILQARVGVDDVDRVQVADFAERIANGAERLDALVESMLAHANVSTLARESVEYSDLRAMALEICDGISEMSDGVSPTFVIGELPSVRLPADAAERVLRNLIDNALKYRAPARSPVVELSAESFSDGIRVRIRDNGVGIAPEASAEIFDLFEQADGESGGAGVGLAVVQQLLAVRGAKIWVESEVGHGTTFVMEFPLSAVRPRSSDDVV